MKRNRKEWLKAASALALGLLLVATAASGSAQRKERRGRAKGSYGSSGGSAELRETAKQAGYNEGIKAGRIDRGRSERFNFTDESEYKEATEGYSSSFGSRTLYQRHFRVGFRNGYREGWNGN